MTVAYSAQRPPLPGLLRELVTVSSNASTCRSAASTVVSGAANPERDASNALGCLTRSVAYFAGGHLADVGNLMDGPFGWVSGPASAKIGGLIVPHTDSSHPLAQAVLGLPLYQLHAPTVGLTPGVYVLSFTGCEDPASSASDAALPGGDDAVSGLLATMGGEGTRAFVVRVGCHGASTTALGAGDEDADCPLCVEAAQESSLFFGGYGVERASSRKEIRASEAHAGAFLGREALSFGERGAGVCYQSSPLVWGFNEVAGSRRVLNSLPSMRKQIEVLQKTNEWEVGVGGVLRDRPRPWLLVVHPTARPARGDLMAEWDEAMSGEYYKLKVRAILAVALVCPPISNFAPPAGRCATTLPGAFTQLARLDAAKSRPHRPTRHGRPPAVARRWRTSRSVSSRRGSQPRSQWLSALGVP